MECRWQVGNILWRFCLTLTLLTITDSIAFRLDDTKSTVKHIPLTKVDPDGGFGFLQGAGFQFERELKELNNFRYRFRRSAKESLRVHNRTKISEEFELKGDNHTVAFLHWSGKNSPVIYIYTCGKVNQTQSGHLLCEDGYFWRSTDYGTTFNREDYKFKSQTTNNVDFCASNHKKVIVSVLKPKKSTLFISEDEGETFESCPLSFTPHVVSCSPASDKLIVAHDQHANKVYYSVDGKRWTFLAENVLRHYWGRGSEVLLEVQTGKVFHTSELRHALLPCNKESDCVKVFDKSLGSFSSHSLKVEGKYVFVEKDLYTSELHVFYQSGSNSSKNFFQKAQFPLDIEEKSYTIVDASEGEVMVVVRHEKEHNGQTYYNLYVSDITGVKYSLSLENILSDKTSIWGRNTTLVDIHRVKSLNGTYLANVFITDEFDSVKYKSVITFNKGGEWHPLRPPVVDHNGLPTNCDPPKCSLHIHMVLSRWYFYIPPVLTSSSAVGIIVAQGNLGSGLGRGRIGVFLSRDGGLTWTKEFNNFHDFVIGDHGGILAAVPMGVKAEKVWYSCTEGKAWKNVTLGSEPVSVFGMVTEPGETTLIFNVFGQYVSHSFQWLSVKLNFTSVLDQKCQVDNYTYWSPNDERVDGDCLLGQHIVYERRKAGDCCFNGEEYEREINISTCTCELDDFECDFGYEHPELSELCMATSSAAPVPAVCPEGKTYQHTRGYRKVVGDRCKDGLEDKLMPETRPCPIRAPSQIDMKFDASFKHVEVNTKVDFTLSQKQGSTESTWYAWDFGDGSPVLNITGLSNAEHVSHTFKEHGHYIVNVTLANKAGRNNFSVEVIVLDPIAEVEIEPPHAVVVREEAWFSVTLHSSKLVQEKTSHPEYGLTHYMWIFETVTKDKNPLLTWDEEVSHTFNRPGTFDVSVFASNMIGQRHKGATITVHEVLTTVRLSFESVLDNKNGNTTEWRTFFAGRLKGALCTALKVKPDRLEVFVLRGLPTKSDVSITPAQLHTSKTRTEIVKVLKEKVDKRLVKVSLPNDVPIRVTHVEVLPDREYGGSASPPLSPTSKSGMQLVIGVSIAASLVVVFLVVTLLYFLRRYNLLRIRYTHLRLYSDGAQLRDPLVEDDEDNETDDEQSLHPQPGGSIRYVPVPTSAVPEPDSDEELIDNFGTGSLAIMPDSQNGQAQTGNANV